MTTPKKSNHGGARPGAGRPVGKGAARYRPEHAELAHGLALLGMDDGQMADALGVDTETLSRWKRRHPELADAIRRGGVEADIEVVKALHRLATGYEVIVQRTILRNGKVVLVPVVKKIPPCPKAAKFFLVNRLAQRHGKPKDTPPEDGAAPGTDPQGV